MDQVIFENYKTSLITSSKDFCCPITTKLLDKDDSVIVQFFGRSGWRHYVAHKSALQSDKVKKAIENRMIDKYPVICTNMDHIAPRIAEFSEAEYRDLAYGMGSPGICLYCHEQADGVEPDAENYECDYCGKKAVYGLEQALVCGYIKIKE